MIGLRKPCPGCDHLLPRRHFLTLRPDVLYRCVHCGCFYRWRGKPALFASLAIAAPALVLIAILAAEGRWYALIALLGATLAILVLVSLVAIRPAVADPPETRARARAHA